MIALILQLDYQTSMTKDRSLDRDLDVLLRTHLSTLTDASTFISVPGSETVGRPQLDHRHHCIVILPDIQQEMKPDPVNQKVEDTLQWCL